MVEKYWKHYTIIPPCMDHGHWPSSMFLLVLAARDRYNKTAADTDFSEMHTHKSYLLLYTRYVQYSNQSSFVVGLPWPTRSSEVCLDHEIELPFHSSGPFRTRNVQKILAISKLNLFRELKVSDAYFSIAILT